MSRSPCLKSLTLWSKTWHRDLAAWVGGGRLVVQCPQRIWTSRYVEFLCYCLRPCVWRAKSGGGALQWSGNRSSATCCTTEIRTMTRTRKNRGHTTLCVSPSSLGLFSLVPFRFERCSGQIGLIAIELYVDAMYFPLSSPRNLDDGQSSDGHTRACQGDGRVRRVATPTRERVRLGRSSCRAAGRRGDRRRRSERDGG
jgi:hypothetical protein